MRVEECVCFVIMLAVWNRGSEQQQEMVEVNSDVRCVYVSTAVSTFTKWRL
jgi:hypothetical protein